MVLQDLLRAASDVSLLIMITLVLLGITLLMGLLMRRWSLRHHKRPVAHGWNHRKKESSWAVDFWQGFSTEMFGAVLTTLLLGLTLLVFEQYQDIQNRKADLILQMGSPDNAFAVEAVRQLEAEGWLQDGTLQGADLRNADLQDADLAFANLQDASLLFPNLQDASLSNTNLQDADLWLANLQDAVLWDANLLNANLQDANLQDAVLWDANLQDAVLWDANLQDAVLRGVNLQNTRLPDGSTGTPETDMGRFTNPDHPDFWNPCTEVDPVPRYCE